MSAEPTLELKTTELKTTELKTTELKTTELKTTELKTTELKTTELKTPAGRNAAVGFVFITLVLDIVALGIIIPVLPTLVTGFAGGDASHAARIYGTFGTIWALMQFVASPVLGALSDRFGRRPVLLLSNVGLGLDYVLMALAPSLGWLFVGRIISGITAASFSTASAYIADVTPPEKRAASYGMVGAAWGFGFVIGPAAGGLLGSHDPRLPFWVAAGLALLNATYGFFVLPESLPKERRSPFAWSRANPLGALKLLRSHRELLGLATVSGLFFLAHHVLTSVFVLYGQHRYGWKEQTVGLTLTGVGVANIIVQGGLIRPLIKRLGERKAMVLGLCFGTAGFALYGLASSPWMFWCSIPVFSMMGLYGPSAQALMTKRVSPSEQGQLQGASSSIMGLTGVVGPTLFTFTFAYFISSDRSVEIAGAPFFLAAGLMVIALLQCLRVLAKDS